MISSLRLESMESRHEPSYISIFQLLASTVHVAVEVICSPETTKTNPQRAVRPNHI